MKLPRISRRQALLGGLAAATGGAAPPALALDTERLGEPLSVQALAIRRFLARDFAGTLRLLRAMGFGQIELASFPGMVGNFRGDFAPLEKLAPQTVRRELERAGLPCRSCHFLPAEFEPARWSQTLDWARGVGIRTMVLVDVHVPSRPSADAVKRFVEILNATGEQVKAAGLQMALHTDASLWSRFGDGLVADAVLAQVDAARCQLQLDFASVVQGDADGAALIDRYRGRITSLHLRDGRRPVDPEAYLPALPLGEGEVNWGQVMAAARRAGIRQYIVEMQLRPAFGMLDGLKTSIDYLRALKL